MDDEKKAECSDGDTVTVIGPQVDGVLPCVRHEPDHKISIGFVQELKPGQPVTKDDLFFKHREGNVYDVVPATSGGPAQVATKAYRSNYENINWSGRKAPVGQA